MVVLGAGPGASFRDNGNVNNEYIKNYIIIILYYKTKFHKTSVSYTLSVMSTDSLKKKLSFIKICNLKEGEDALKSTNASHMSCFAAQAVVNHLVTWRARYKTVTLTL